MTRLLRGAAVCVAPVLVALYVAGTTFDGASSIPWRPLMVDLEVYRQAGAALLAGQNFYALPGSLPFLYPPFAAVLAVPLALLPAAVAQIGWTVAGALAITAVLHRYRLGGWRLALVGAAVMFFVQPVAQTLAFGQLGIFLVALVALDLTPGPTVLPRRLLPRGTLTGLAAAIKLTPAIFVVYLLAARRFRAAVVAIVAGLAVTLVSAAVVPQASLDFWSRLAHGDTGLGHSLIYYTNQSVMADVVRIFGLGRPAALAGLAASAVVGLAGVWAAVLWHRLGEVPLAVNLCGVAGLLASPVSWLHHFVWVVPLALSLVSARRLPLPRGLLVIGWVFVGWVVAVYGSTSAAPFARLPNGADLELQWSWSEQLLASVTAMIGIGLITVAIVTAQRRRLARRPGEPVEQRVPAAVNTGPG